MPHVVQADKWDEVWAEYDTRQMTLASVRGTRPARAVASARHGSVERVTAARAGVRPVRPWTQAVMAGFAGCVLLALWLTLPWMLAARLSSAIGGGDAPALLRQFDAPVALASIRAGLEAEVQEGMGEGARRYLSDMAARMASSLQRPEGMRAWLALRARGGNGEGSPAPLSTLRAARPTGLGAFRVEYGPARGEGGVAFDLAWQGTDFRVVGVRFLEPAARPWPATVLAMR
ncbi:hypothetical protein [Muricoccus radiodurans]|uniref:hypothetical protein n=1 Tax=Muricoccus radiodurans TaxID=2231721 RepID=UPI003CE8417A